MLPTKRRDRKGARAGSTSPLHPTRTAAFQQRLHIVDRAAIEIAGHRVLQTTRRHRELERLLVRPERIQPVDQAPRETIAAADAIDDVRDLVMPAQQKLLAIVVARRPAV